MGASLAFEFESMQQEEHSNEELEADEFQQVSFHKIEELEQHGVAKSDIQKLKGGGFHTIEAV